MDFTACTNDRCPRRTECYRYMLVPNPKWQSYALFTGDKCYLKILPGDRLKEVSKKV